MILCNKIFAWGTIIGLSLLLGSCVSDSFNPTTVREEPEPATVPNGLSSENCPCYNDKLYHLQNFEHSQGIKIAWQLPDGRIEILKKAPTGELNLGSVDANWLKSQSNILLVESNSFYEKDNALSRRYYQKCMELCQNKAPQSEYDRWFCTIYGYPFERIIPRRTPAQHTLPAGLSQLNKSDKGVKFCYGYTDTTPAELRVVFQYQHGQKMFPHPTSKTYRLPSNGNFSINLAEVGFIEIPKVWDFKILLITSTMDEYIIRDFSEGV